MSLLKLQIRQYSEPGDLMNIVSCAVNKVSVFRSNDPFYLDEYAKLLAGAKTQGRYSLQLDGRPYKVADPMLVGFPGRGVATSTYTVREALEEGGVAPKMVKKLLGNFGLWEMADLLLRNLPACEKRRIEILAALFHSEHRVAVFHDPFLPLGFEWRDTFAELTAVFATEHAKIVIVTGLSHRPESWIENPQIVRVRVDKVRRRTVGFSSEDDEMDSLVHELRENLAQEDIEDSEDLQEEQEAEFYVPPVPLPFGKPESIETETTRMPAIDSFHPHSPTSTGSWQRNEWLTELTEGLGHVSSEMKRLSARSAPSRAGLWVAVGMLLMLATLVFVLAPGQAPDTEVARLTVPGPETAAAKHYDTGKRVLDEYPVRIRESVLLAYVGSSDEVDSIQELLSTEVLEPGAQSSGKDARPNSIDNVPAAKSADDLDGSLKVEASDID